MVQELFPAPVARVPQMDMDERITVRFSGLSDEFHFGLYRGSSPFFGIAANTGTYDVLPHGFSPHAPGKHVIEAQLAVGQPTAAILTAMAVACEKIPPVQAERSARDAVVAK